MNEEGQRKSWKYDNKFLEAKPDEGDDNIYEFECKTGDVEMHHFTGTAVAISILFLSNFGAS